ncbi:low molecular weight phosphatase family protein [Christiangramia sabulilitoris]|uniref:Protein-tyrosine-phosphatase n=1 Tax=Christiangramia sabulilitoris TaxID=2583991 RepID=A0A550I2N9_9FLAO|nr:protein-tyrosine-phosphatase [Christiangramia sabulilitoris]TRO65250.1 protein-tyrosine-phosphatase [Christiangramia sabulilitoris]
MSRIELYPELQKKLYALKELEIPEARKEILQPLIDYIREKKRTDKEIRLNFICTHNSRRSQLAQVWAQAISDHFGIKTVCFSGGTEETAFFSSAIDALRRAGFKIDANNDTNPEIKVSYSEESNPLICYSKVFDSPVNPSDGFAALMTCSHADENCPFIQGAEIRIPLDYEDPKKFDGTPEAAGKYTERSDQIASEMIYVFENIR